MENLSSFKFYYTVTQLGLTIIGREEDKLSLLLTVFLGVLVYRHFLFAWDSPSSVQICFQLAAEICFQGDSPVGLQSLPLAF